MKKTMLRKLLLGVLVLVLFCTTAFTACAQASVSGRYECVGNEDSIYSYFEFTDRNTVRVGMNLMGLKTEQTFSYSIKNGHVVMEDRNGVAEMKIINANTLEGIGNLFNGVRFIKQSSTGQSTSGKNQNTDSRFNGKWISDNGQLEFRSNNGNFEITLEGFLFEKGTYTTSGNNLLPTVTHFHGSFWEFESKWYTKKEIRAALGTSRQGDLETLEMFEKFKVTYSGNTLIFTFGDITEILTKK